MRPYLLMLFVLCTAALPLRAQYVYTIKADSVKITNHCDTAELILENHTQNVLGFLYNKGRGRTEFRRIIKLNDSTLIFGEDTLVIKTNITALNGLSKTSDSIHLGQDLIYGDGPAGLLSDREIPLNSFSVYFTGPPAASNTEYVAVKSGAIDIKGSSWNTGSTYINMKDESDFFSDSARIGLVTNLMVPDASPIAGSFQITNFSSSNPTIATQHSFVIQNPYSTSGNQLLVTGEALSGSATGNGIRLSREWNTTGVANAIDVDIFNTASDASSKLIKLAASNDTKFSVSMTGTGRFTDSVFAPKLFLTDLNTGTGSDSLLVKNMSGEVKKISQSGISGYLNRAPINDANHTATSSDYLIAYISISTGRTVTLPAASSMTNRTIIVKDESGSAGTSNITIDGFGSETIDGVASKTVNTNFGSITLYSNGSAWFTIHQ